MNCRRQEEWNRRPDDYPSDGGVVEDEMTTIVGSERMVSNLIVE